MNMRRGYFVWFIFCLFSLHGSLVRSVESETIPDSLLAEDYIYEYTFSDFNKAVRILELMREQKKLPGYRLDIAEGDLYFNTGKYLRALKYYQRALDNDSVRNNDEDYMDQLHRMISSYDCLHDEGKKAHYIELLLKKSEECGNVVMQSIAQFNMGKMLYYQEDTRRGYEMVNKAIELMRNSDYKYKYDNLRYNYNTLLIMQQRDQLYTEALHTLDLLESTVTKSTDLEPSIEGLADKERKTLYAQRAVILSQLGRKQEAEQAYLEWRRIGHVYDKDNYLIIPFLMNEGRYKEVIALYTERENFLREQNDTINYHMLTAKRTLARAYEKMGNYKRAASYFNELAVLTDSLKVREQKSAAMELATVYETHEKEDKIKEQQQDLRLRDTFLAGGVFFIGLLLVLLWVVWRNHHTMKGKNHSMAMQIDRLLTYQEELEALKEQLKKVKLATESIDPKSKELDLSEENFSKENIDSVFEQISYLVKDKKLYLDNQLSRDMILNEISISKTVFARVIQAKTGANFISYVNELRINHSIKLLKQYPNYTIESIAMDSGFNNVRSYYRVFKERFDMSPTEYRKAMEKKA